MINVIETNKIEAARKKIAPRGGCDCGGTSSQKDVMSYPGICNCACFTTAGKSDVQSGAYYS